jgi:hypothetical protein
MDNACALPFDVLLNGARVPSSTVAHRAGANVLSLATTLPSPNLALTLQSTYCGARGTQTRVLHLQQGPPGTRASIEDAAFDDAAPHACMVIYRPRDCGYDHAARLMSWLNDLGYKASLNLDDHAFERLEAVE